MVKAQIFLHLFLGIIFICSIGASVFYPLLLSIPLIIGLLYISIAVYKTIYYNRSHLKMHTSYVHFRKGIFFNDYFYVLYDNVKGVDVLRYPTTTKGNVSLNIAGEIIVQKNKNQQQHVISNSLTINYIDRINDIDEIVDYTLQFRPSKQQLQNAIETKSIFTETPLLEQKPNVMNVLLPSLITIIIPPLALLLIPLIVWSTLVISYKIDKFRVVVNSGIIYKRQQSIIFNKIDHINQNQGMLNKLFKNGSIDILTTGSSQTEMGIMNIPEYEKFYAILKQYYQHYQKLK